LAHWDSELRFRAINPVLAAMNGLPAEAHLGRGVEEVLGRLGEDVAGVLRQVLSTGRAVTDLVQTGETPARLGVRRRWQTSYHPVVEGGEVTGVVAIVEELTEREAAAESAHRAATASAALDAVYAETPVGLAFWNRDLRFERVNQALARFNGRSVDDHLGRTAEELLGPDAVPPRELLEQVIATGQAVTDLPLETGEGECARQWEVTCYPVDVDGELLGVGCVVREVTERRRGEATRTELVRQSVTARAQAEAAQVRAEAAAEEAARERELAEAARRRSEFLSAAGAQMGASLDVAATLEAVVGAAVPTVADWCTLTLKRTSGALETVAVAHADPEKVAIAREMIARHPPDPDAPAGPRTSSARAARRSSTTSRTSCWRPWPPTPSTCGAPPARAAALRRGPDPTPRGIAGAFSFVYADESGRRPGPADVQLVESLASRAALHLENARLYAESRTSPRRCRRACCPTGFPRSRASSSSPATAPRAPRTSRRGLLRRLPLRGGDLDRGHRRRVRQGRRGRRPDRPGAPQPPHRRAAVRRPDRQSAHAQPRDDQPGRRGRALRHRRLRPRAPGRRAAAGAAHRGERWPSARARVPGRRHRRGDHGDPWPARGHLPHVDFTAVDVALEAGDLLLLYTDGIVELRGPDGVFGEELLRSRLAASAGRPAGEAVAAIAAAAADAQVGEARDDLALLALRVRP
jgi:PAS domain-containing protein